MSTVTWHVGQSLEHMEKLIILEAFKQYRGNKTQTASSLGINIRTLERKLEEYAAADEKVKSQEEKRKNETLSYIERARGLPNNQAGGRGEYVPDNRAHWTPEQYARVEADKVRLAKSTGTSEVHSDGEKVDAGVQLESANEATSKYGMPLPERKEVQKMPSEQIANGNKKRAR